MACAIVTNWGNIIKWTTPNQKDISHVEVYRRTDAVTASITTADIVAKVPNVANTEQAFPYFYDLFTALNTSTSYWYWLKSVAYDGQRSDGVAPDVHQTITADRSTLTDIPDGAVTNEPTGFPNRTDSTMSWTDGTRTLSISPTTTSFDYYIKGQKFTVTAAKTVVPTETSGATWFYFDSATLTATSNITHDQVEVLIEEKVLVAFLYWNTAQATHVYFGEERHGLTMDGATHHYLHDIEGLRFHDGFALGNFTADQTGADNVDAQFSVAAGEVYDEDINYTAAAVASTTGLPIFYRDGASGNWRSTTNAGYSVVTAAAGTRLVWNENVAGTWQQTEIGNNQFVLCHVFATTEDDTPAIAIMGQAEYSNVAAAQSGATTEVASIITAELPGPEMLPIGTVIFQTSNAYGNQVGARVRSVSGGGDYIDWRETVPSGGGAAASDHGSLGGLADDDHTQYLILDGSRGAQSISADVSFGNAVTISGALTVNDTATVSYLTVTANASVGGTLHVSGATTLGGGLAVSGATTINNSITVSTLNVTGSASVQTTLHVSGAATFGSTVAISGATTINNSLGVSGVATVSTLNVTANASVGGTLHVSGAVTFGSTLTVSSTVTVGTNLAVCGTTTLHNNVIICGALTICGSATLNGTALGSGGEISTVFNGSSITTSDLEFVTADFTVTTASGTCATVSLASALVLDGGLTVNGGLNVSGNVTVSGNTSLNGTLTVSGTSTLQGAVTISGGLTVNTITLTGDLTMCGTLTVNGTAITNASELSVVFNASAITTSDLVFNTASFTVTTGTGTCATVSIIADGIACSHIDWGDGADQVNAYQMPIGSPTDSSWADGLESWTNDTLVADALDDINETMSYLAPDDAGALAGALTSSGTVKYTGYLAQGATNYASGDPAGTLVSYIIDDPDFTLSSADTATSFNKADEGETRWYHAVGAAAYGLAEDAVLHTANFTELEREGTQSGTPWITGALRVDGVGWYNSFPKWQIGRCSVTVDVTDVSRGYNRFKFTRECGFTTQTSDDFEIFYDDGIVTPTLGTISASENTPVIRRLSGVRFYDRGSTFNINMDCANGTISYSYNSTRQLHIASTPTNTMGTIGNKAYNDAGIQNYGTSPPTYAGVIGITALTTTVPTSNVYSTNARIQVTAYNIKNGTAVGRSASENRLINGYVTTSGALDEYFYDEDRRISADADFTDKTLTLTGVWCSDKTLINGEAQLLSGSLTYPSINFNSGYLPTGQSADYSAFSGDQEYYRGMYDSGGTPHQSGQIQLGGLVNADVGSDGTGAINVFIKLPTQTGWLDLGVAYDVGVFSGADGDGCRTAQSGDDWSWSSGSFSTANSGDRYYIKVVLRNGTRDITQIRELGW